MRHLPELWRLFILNKEIYLDTQFIFLQRSAKESSTEIKNSHFISDNLASSRQMNLFLLKLDSKQQLLRSQFDIKNKCARVSSQASEAMTMRLS